VLDSHVVFVANGASQGVLGRARDISIAGMYVYTTEPPAVGTDVTVRVILPYQTETIVLPGVVRWTRAGLGMGVQFSLVGARETHAITDYVDARLRRTSGTRAAVSLTEEKGGAAGRRRT
jgi:hypothetical protein